MVQICLLAICGCQLEGKIKKNGGTLQWDWEKAVCYSCSKNGRSDNKSILDLKEMLIVKRTCKFEDRINIFFCSTFLSLLFEQRTFNVPAFIHVETVWKKTWKILILGYKILWFTNFISSGHLPGQPIYVQSKTSWSTCIVLL